MLRNEHDRVGVAGHRRGIALRRLLHQAVAGFAALVAFGLAVQGRPADAAIFTVGSGAGCTHGTIQSAIAAANANPGADTVRITRSLAYTGVGVQINTAQDLNVVGGFATCDQAATDNIKTTVSGAGGAHEPVFLITADTGSTVKLRHLTITDGDVDGAGKGGGIYFRGDGILEVIETTISYNVAGGGAGIYAEGTGSNTELILSAGAQVIGNSARYNGGGVFADGVEMTMNATDSIIAFNEAVGVYNSTIGQTVGGYGGGLMVFAGARTSVAYIGSPGVNGTGPVYSNEARYGGGVAVIYNSDDYPFAELRMYSSSAATQTAIRGNFASVAGGGLYVFADDGGGFVIGNSAEANLWNASIEDNAAPAGAAAFIEHTPGFFPARSSGLSFNPFGYAPPAAALACPIGAPCGSIAGNLDLDLNGQPTGGAVILLESGNSLGIDTMSVTGNRGGQLVRATGDDTTTEITNTLIGGNIASGELLRSEGNEDLLVENTTIAGNAIGSANVISNGGSFRLQRSILWQPGRTSLASSGSRTVQNVVTSERFSLDGGSTPYVLEQPPRFVDEANQDFRLVAASPAVDFASSGGGPDLVGVPRGTDLPIKANLFGSGDLGAYERPALQPLVLNADFDSSLNLWPEVTANASSWSNAQNVTGAPGSGSVFVSLGNIPQARIEARLQCVHLPGPGRYKLNGWGHAVGATMATRDGIVLGWEYRRSGGEECNAGPPDASGNHFLGSSNAWTHPASPALIDVSAADWTHTSSITVILVVNDLGTTFPASVAGYFDGITLEVDAGDLIFANGFEA